MSQMIIRDEESKSLGVKHNNAIQFADDVQDTLDDSNSAETSLTAKGLKTSKIYTSLRTDCSDREPGGKEFHPELAKRINYGNFYVLLKYKEFPILVFPHKYGVPLFSLFLVIACKVVGGGYLVYIVFDGHPWLQELFQWVSSLLVVFMVIFLVMNPGIAGFDLGSAYHKEKNDE